MVNAYPLVIDPYPHRGYGVARTWARDKYPLKEREDNVTVLQTQLLTPKIMQYRKRC